MWYEDKDDSFLPDPENLKESEADRRGYEMCEDGAVAHVRGDEKLFEALRKERCESRDYPRLYMLKVNLRTLFGFPSTGMWSELRNSIRAMGDKKQDIDPETARKFAEIKASYERFQWANSLKKGQS